MRLGPFPVIRPAHGIRYSMTLLKINSERTNLRTTLLPVRLPGDPYTMAHARRTLITYPRLHWAMSLVFSLESLAGSFRVPLRLSNEKSRLIAQWRRGYVISAM